MLLDDLILYFSVHQRTIVLYFGGMSLAVWRIEATAPRLDTVLAVRNVRHVTRPSEASVLVVKLSLTKHRCCILKICQRLLKAGTIVYNTPSG